MFTMMKGLEALGIDTLTVGGFDIDWFDPCLDQQLIIFGLWMPR